MTMKVPNAYDGVVYRNGHLQGVHSTIFSSNMPHRAPVLCYIAGVECPITSATVSYGVWKIPEASVTMFPDPALQRLGAQDRVPIVLFYLDEYIEYKRPTWRMLFEGEIVGWGYNNSALGRALTFQCVMDIAMWTQLFLFYMTTVTDIAQGHLTKEQDPAQLNQATALYPHALFSKGLITEGDTGTITRPYDFAYNVIRALIDHKVPNALRCIPAVNFFSRWIKRQQFHNKWVALPFLDEKYSVDDKPEAIQPSGIFPILRAVQSDQGVQALKNHTASSAQGASVYTMLKQVLDTVYMELVMLPTPAAVSTTTDGNIYGPPKITSTGKAGPVDATKPIRLTNYFIKPQMFFGLPPVCNVIFPSMTPEIQYSENYVTQPTRLYFEDATLPHLTDGGTSLNTRDFFIKKLARAYPPEADERYRAVMEKKELGTGRNVLIWPEEFFKGPVTARFSAPTWLMYVSQQESSVGAASAPSAAEAYPTTPEPNTTSAVPPPTVGESVTDQDLYVLYAQYEYFRQCYSQRGGAVTCAFQPYLVPGFSTMIFDNFHSKMHLIGYLMNVTHQFAPGNVTTATNFSYARTLYEFFQDVANEIEEGPGMTMAAAPPDPIPEVRSITQHFNRADQFYQTLFYRRPQRATRPAVFQYRDILRFVKDDGSLEPITVNGLNEEYIARRRKTIDYTKSVLTAYLNDGALQAEITAGTKDTTNLRQEIAKFSVSLDADQAITPEVVTRAMDVVETELATINNPRSMLYHNLSGDKLVVPFPGFEPYFDSYDAAMQYCSRPICTLEEYIVFIEGVREGPIDDYSYDDGSHTHSARYYTRIRRLKGAKASDQATAAQEYRVGTQPQAVPKDFPVLRMPWDEILMDYRQRIYTALRVNR